MDFGFAAVPAIVVISYLVAEVIKGVTKNETASRLIPAVCGLTGFVLGIISYYAAPQLLQVNDVLSASAIGIVSGFAATGINQVYKQLGTDNK